MAIDFNKPLREVHTIYIHCSDSDNPDHDIDEVRRWHVEDNQWSDIGYHYFIDKKGVWHKGRSLERIPSAQAGKNKGSIAICFQGKKDFTGKQYETGQLGLEEIQSHYDKPLKIKAHNMVNSYKTCPNFNIGQAFNLEPIHKMLKNKVVLNHYVLKSHVKSLKKSRTLKGDALVATGGTGLFGKLAVGSGGAVALARDVEASKSILSSVFDIFSLVWASIPAWLFYAILVIGVIIIAYARIEDYAKEKLKNVFN